MSAAASALRLAVATDCPNCGAPIDFGEGANAIRCGHCRTLQLVTGRKRILAYWIRPRIEASAAKAAVQAAAENAGGLFRVGDAGLWLLPYYRVTGIELRCEMESRPESLQTAAAWEIERTFTEIIPKTLSRAAAVQPREPVFRDRHVDKNFLALEAANVPFSIGVRATVLRLELFRREAVERLGRWLPPATSPDAALEIGTRTIGGREHRRREIVARRTALLYFPYWTVALARPKRNGFALVDAVTGSVTTLELEADFRIDPAAPPPVPGPTLGFRPLLCPNCGWDLPLRPDDSVLCCGQCARAWQIVGEELVAVPVWVAAPPAAPARERQPRPRWKELPYWRIAGASGTARYVPAFRFRRLKSLVDLAASYARKPPVLEASAEPPKDLVGVYFDREDADGFARFVAEEAGVPPPNGADEATLVWIPYRDDGYSLVDPHFGVGLASRLLL